MTLDDARSLDRDDPFAEAARLFDLPDGMIYLDGNSLGPPPKPARQALDHAISEEWGQDLIASWNSADWMGLPLRTGARIARLIGAPENSVIACDSVSVNLFKLAAGLVMQGRKGVAVERGDFPTDGYIMEGLSALSGTPFTYIEPGAGVAGLPDGVEVLVRSAVHYKTAAIVDIAAEERQADRLGKAIIWDLSHAAGVIDLKLERDGAKYAAGCGYKYLNGGPGAPAFIYCRPDMAEGFSQPLSGWMGHVTPFAFQDGYKPAGGVSRFAAGTPSVLAMTALYGALSVFDGVDMGVAEAKARALGDTFLEAVSPLGLATISAPSAQRGGHVSLVHEDGYAIVQALIAEGVIGDFRAPDIMRFGFAPLYLTHEQVFRAGQRLLEIVRSGLYRDPRFAERRAVT
ncbi:MAG: aminotransferase class V-fold PLP-dependent enzyme [Oceanicaulis sp.]|uniref:kynureninase/PvdN C-terminal domain-containing protein n=1 Tax=Glycocaulis sp. TaxID=1969725 RepID=UPI0025BD14FB|nr:kynureninase [Glycocaulis sp.]MCC5981258.1 aminotransferase class V-fold PLP-dependent enzyme [Oceanicaulis sp.]MCH8520798.1 kynureninase [Glycocaulis sp.]